MKKLIIIIVIIAAGVTATFFIKPSRLRAPTERPITSEQNIQTPQVTNDHVVYYGKESKNAFELLQETTNIEFKKYDFGVFVESINGVKPDSQHFWKLYINGQEAQTGADSIITKTGDTVEWKLEEIK